MTAEQARLLQIGDIVIKERENSEDVVSYLDFEGNCNTISLVKDRQAFSPDEIEQIPLTQEILEKNGFEAHTGGRAIDYSFPKEIDTRPVPFASSLCIIQGGDTFFIEDHTLIKFKTVDEFQRLLRLIGYIDFANRFKV